jgi:hypothetical protein
MSVRPQDGPVAPSTGCWRVSAHAIALRLMQSPPRYAQSPGSQGATGCVCPPLAKQRKCVTSA